MHFFCSCLTTNIMSTVLRPGLKTHAPRETSFGDPDQSVQANAGKDLATERSKMPLLFPQSDLLPLNYSCGKQRWEHRESLWAWYLRSYSLQNITVNLQCVGAPSFEDLSWDTVFSWRSVGGHGGDDFIDFVNSWRLIKSHGLSFSWVLSTLWNIDLWICTSLA